MKRKIMPTQILRFFVQLISFIFFPVSFAILLSQIKSIYLAFLGKQSFSFNLNFIILLVTLAITVFLGRFFCGWICAFGTTLERLNFLGRKIFKKQLNIPRKADEILKVFKYFVLAYLVIMIWTFEKGFYVDPWDAFDSLLSLNFAVKTYLPSFIVLVITAFLSLFINRVHCRYVCPLGAIFNIFSRLKLLFVKKDSKNCGKCLVCSNSCPMGIEMENVENYKGGCITCVKCIESCPRFNLALNIANTKINPRYTSAAFIAGILSLSSFFTTSFISFPPKKSVASNSISASLQSVQEDNYAAKEDQSSQQNEIIASNNQIIEQSDNQITDSSNQSFENTKTNSSNTQQSISQKENTDAKQSAQNSESAVSNSEVTEQKSSQITDKNIQNSQSTVSTSQNVETSNDANIQTQQSSQDSSSTVSSSQSTQQNTSQQNSTQETSSKIYKDGTYTGEGFGYRPGLVVEVTIKNDKIVDIKIVSHNETPSFAQLPFEIIPKEIIEAQSTDVDTISGATRTSYGIISAVEDALSKARIENSETSQN